MRGGIARFCNTPLVCHIFVSFILLCDWTNLINCMLTTTVVRVCR